MAQAHAATSKGSPGARHGTDWVEAVQAEYLDAGVDGLGDLPGAAAGDGQGRAVRIGNAVGTGLRSRCLPAPLGYLADARNQGVTGSRLSAGRKRGPQAGEFAQGEGPTKGERIGLQNKESVPRLRGEDEIGVPHHRAGERSGGMPVGSPPSSRRAIAEGPSIGCPARPAVLALADTTGASSAMRTRHRRSAIGERHKFPVHTNSTENVTARLCQTSEPWTPRVPPGPNRTRPLMRR